MCREGVQDLAESIDHLIKFVSVMHEFLKMNVIRIDGQTTLKPSDREQSIPFSNKFPKDLLQSHGP